MLTYSNPFLIVRLFLTQNRALPSSEFKCSPMHVLSRVSLFCAVMFFLVLIHLQQVANSAFSHCASPQLVMCRGVNLRAQTCASSSRRSHSALKDRQMSTSPLSVTFVTAPLSRDCTMSVSCHTGTQLSLSATALSDPFWYSTLNSYNMSAPTQWCPVASRFGVVSTYVRGLLSVHTVNGA